MTTLPIPSAAFMVIDSYFLDDGVSLDEFIARELPDLHPDDATLNAIAQYVLENNHAPYKDVI